MYIIVLLYALLILVGGFIGHYKSASQASLISGLIFGSLLLICAAGMFRKKRWGTYGALGITFLLDGFFSWRFIKTHVFMPPGLLSLISLGVLLLIAKSISKETRT
jgi:uncharacterized membrane protein (UPF0136 family)